MSYTYDRTFPDDAFDVVEQRVRTALSDHGFGVLTEIDVQATMKTKVGADMPRYTILGACNPKMAWEALTHEPRVGAMLPCNVILRDTDHGVEVSAVDPAASMAAINNADLKAIATQVRSLLAQAVDAA